jgi:2-dehydropantoate 2-reductase
MTQANQARVNLPDDHSSDLLIVGTGALACLFASRLSAAGFRIAMLGSWRNGLTALQEYGVRLVDPNGNEHSYPVLATDDPKKCKGAGLALVLVKAWQTEKAALQLDKCLTDDGLAVTLQNGLGNIESLARVLDKKGGQRRTAIGVTTTGATLLGPGLVRAGGEGVISLERQPGIAPLENAMKSAGFHVEISDATESLVWGKLLVNAAINPLTAILRVPNGALLERPPARELMAELALETAAVCRAEKITLPFPDPVAAVEEVVRKTASNRSSMLQDVLRGAPTEIDAISGAVVMHGERTDVPTPASLLCWKMVKASVYKTTDQPLEHAAIHA